MWQLSLCTVIKGWIFMEWKMNLFWSQTEGWGLAPFPHLCHGLPSPSSRSCSVLAAPLLVCVPHSFIFCLNIFQMKATQTRGWKTKSYGGIYNGSLASPAPPQSCSLETITLAINHYLLTLYSPHSHIIMSLFLVFLKIVSLLSLYTHTHTHTHTDLIICCLAVA